MASLLSDEEVDEIVARWCRVARIGSLRSWLQPAYHPLEPAVFFGSVSDVQVLIERGAESARRISTGVYEDRLLEGIDYETRKFTEMCGSLLSTACFRNVKRSDAAIPRYLISQGAALDFLQREGDVDVDLFIYPLYCAARENNVELVRLFLDAGANVNEYAVDGTAKKRTRSHEYTLLGRCAFPGIDEELFRLLLDHGADIDARDDAGGFTALYYACHHDPHLGKARLLLERGADVNANSHVTAGTALMIAVTERSGPDWIARLVRRHGAAVDLADEETGRTALMHAADRGYLDGVRALLDAGANVAARDLTSQTALMLAARNGWHKIVQILVDWPGVKETIAEVDNRGASALCHAAIGYESFNEIAFNYGHKVGRPFPHYKEVLDILLANGAEADERFYETLARSEHYRLQSFQKNLL